MSRVTVTACTIPHPCSWSCRRYSSCKDKCVDKWRMFRRVLFTPDRPLAKARCFTHSSSTTGSSGGSLGGSKAASTPWPCSSRWDSSSTPLARVLTAEVRALLNMGFDAGDEDQNDEMVASSEETNAAQLTFLDVEEVTEEAEPAQASG